MSTTKDGIIIREFELKDLNRVRTLFRMGMMAHVPILARVVTKHRIGTIDLTNPFVFSLPCLVLALRQSFWDERNFAWLYIGSVLMAILVWFSYFRYSLSPGLFEEYVQYSLSSDIADIPSVYQRNQGVFLVAVTNDTNHVVGMVGGQFKHNDSTDAAATKAIYELRRMSVDPEQRGRGLGGRLLQALEEKLPNGSRIFADCSNIQHSAQRMYTREGYELTKSFPLKGWPIAFQLWRYEKEI